MNLLTQMMEECQILTYNRADDAYGGHGGTWTEGARFQAAIAKNASTEQQIAEKEGISEAYTVVVPEGFTLDFHSVFKRLRDNAVFRVNSRTKDSTAHPASTVKISVVTAERWVLPT